MEFRTSCLFLNNKKVIQPGKILTFRKKPEISLKVRLFGVEKKFVPLMQGFPNSGKGWEEVKSPQWGGENQKFYCGRKGGAFFLPGEGNLSMSDFDNLNLFQS